MRDLTKQEFPDIPANLGLPIPELMEVHAPYNFLFSNPVANSFWSALASKIQRNIADGVFKISQADEKFIKPDNFENIIKNIFGIRDSNESQQHVFNVNAANQGTATEGITQQNQQNHHAEYVKIDSSVYDIDPFIP